MSPALFQCGLIAHQLSLAKGSGSVRHKEWYCNSRHYLSYAELPCFLKLIVTSDCSTLAAQTKVSWICRHFKRLTILSLLHNIHLSCGNIHRLTTLVQDCIYTATNVVKDGLIHDTPELGELCTPRHM